jgi:hypothetical protein
LSIQVEMGRLEPPPSVEDAPTSVAGRVFLVLLNI